jgi:hypothetical protein
MAISKNNPLTKGASGMLGGTLVFRSWNGKTYMSNRPKKPTKESLLQKGNRQKFRLATEFAKRMMKEPARKAEYKQKALELGLTNAYTAAITEYMRKPDIKEINIEDFEGKQGDLLAVEVSKKGFGVSAVEMVIKDSSGNVEEQGNFTNEKNNVWIYRVSSTLEQNDTYQILARVRERTGNIYEKTTQMINLPFLE